MRLVSASRDIDRRMDDGKPIVDCRFGRVNDIEHKLFLIHGPNRADLDRLIIDDDERRIPGRQQVICEWIADSFAGHLKVSSLCVRACLVRRTGPLGASNARWFPAAIDAATGR